jgi:hypothetical protein
VHTWQSQPIMGTPVDVPVPRKVNRRVPAASVWVNRFALWWSSSSHHLTTLPRPKANGFCLAVGSTVRYCDFAPVSAAGSGTCAGLAR